MFEWNINSGCAFPLYGLRSLRCRSSIWVAPDWSFVCLVLCKGQLACRHISILAHESSSSPASLTLVKLLLSWAGPTERQCCNHCYGESLTSGLKTDGVPVRWIFLLNGPQLFLTELSVCLPTQARRLSAGTSTEDSPSAYSVNFKPMQRFSDWTKTQKFFSFDFNRTW